MSWRRRADLEVVSAAVVGWVEGDGGVRVVRASSLSSFFDARQSRRFFQFSLFLFPSPSIRACSAFSPAKLRRENRAL